MDKTILSKDTLAGYDARPRDVFILIDKPPGWTSFDVVKKIKNIGRFRKVGHAGTLDPFATGLLILGTEKYTRALTTLSESYKAYEGIIEFGEERDTYDVTGRTVRTSEIDSVDLDLIAEKINGMIGESDQTPPMFSAKKIGGKRLYKLARKGVEVERKPQRIEIRTFRITSSADRSIGFYIACSKGTYVRSVAHDIGKLSGYGAYLKTLRRVSIDDYDVQNALTMDEFEHFWSTLN
jgi:tRNA pseudouridine55 synthase